MPKHVPFSRRKFRERWRSFLKRNWKPLSIVLLGMVALGAVASCRAYRINLGEVAAE